MPGLSALVLAKIAGVALAIALSPIPILIVLVLLIHNDRPRGSSIAYLLARGTALGLLVAVGYLLPLPNRSLYQSVPHWTLYVALVIGIGFVAAGVVVWRRRGADRPLPQWQARVGGIPPATSAALGLLPPLVNPKVLAASLAVHSQISALPFTVDAATALTCYLVVATSTVVAPIAVYLILGAHIDARLEGFRQWLIRHQSAATATTLVLIGLTIMLYGSS